MFDVVDYGSLEDGDWDPARISDATNALGGVPAPILYLWVFERPDSLSVQLISHGWVQLGPLQVLVSADARLDDALLRSAAEVEARIARFASAAGTHKGPRFTDLEVFASYRGYPINPLWCADAVWETAFLALAERATYFVVDVTAEEEPTGLAFELQHLFASLPSDRIVLLMDRYRAETKRVLPFLADIWAQAGRGSGAAGPPPLVTYSSSSAGYLARAAMSQWSGRPRIPIASRAATLRGWW